MDENEKFAQIRLIRTRHLGSMTFSLLIQRYGSAMRALAAIPELAAPGRTSVISLADVKAELAAFVADDANLIWHYSEVYPARLTQFNDT